ncbi:CLUMA_CG018185, isoform A [Clunio marinus]|uniref:CLUMA_CG018185, isoform A n=1 Tax=Clunio marinus TaxID=568069 RepID=A0A1J1IYT1_9DIPT|nr:CLUMA_CG018185, isoform A [Clunio marinus]
MSEGEKTNSKVRAFIGQTPKNLKQKFFSVLGTSSEYKKQIITGISNKLDAALSFGSTSETTPENVNEAKLRMKLKEQHEKANSAEYSLDDHIVDYELRRVKERRAHEEVLSGRYRHPAFIERNSQNQDSFQVDSPKKSPPSPVVVVENQNHKHQIDCIATTINHHPMNNSIPTKSTIQALTTKENNLLGIPPTSCSTATSESGDNLSLGDLSFESMEVKMWQKSESESVALSCSSISLDSSSDEVTFEFMRRFVSTLFTDSSSITLELKHQFGQHARLASGRMWFARFVNSQRTKSKRVNETTFYALIQYFAIILFECKDCEDFLPARHLMSLCFTFFQEVEVPGCEPYREYLFNYLRDQPIWHTLRFWNAAFFYALQKDKVPKVEVETARKSVSSVQLKSSEEGNDMSAKKVTSLQSSRSVSESSLSSSSSTDHSKSSGSSKYKTTSNKVVNRSKSSNIASGSADNTFDVDEKKLQDNMAFSHLGSLTCNMHAFGLNRSLCCEFLKKQCHILNLTKEQEKMLNDNVNRLYRETDPWRE